MLSRALWATRITGNQTRRLVSYPKTDFHSILSRIPKKYEPYVRLGKQVKYKHKNFTEDFIKVDTRNQQVMSFFSSPVLGE